MLKYQKVRYRITEATVETKGKNGDIHTATFKGYNAGERARWFIRVCKLANQWRLKIVD